MKIIKLLKDPFISSFSLLIVLLGIFAYLKYQPEINKSRNKTLFPTNSQITKVIIENEEEQELDKKDNSWFIKTEENEKADQTKVESLLNTLEKLEKDELVSQNPDNFSNFNLNEDKAIKVKLFEGENIAFEIWVGDPGPSFNKTYFRLPDENKVYLSNVSLRSKVIQSTWAEPTPAKE